MASRTSWTLPQSAAAPVGLRITLVTRLSVLALRSISTSAADGRRRLEELAEDAARLHLLEVAADAQHERRVAADLRLAADEQRHDDEARRRNGDRRQG